jgi:hypothetical protein
MRARTASAAWRSLSPSRNCRSVTRAKRQGGQAGRPPLGMEIGEILVGEDRAEVVAQRQVGIALREGGAGDTSGLRGDRRRRRLAVK